MKFRFVHMADAHIGGRFAGLARRSEAAAAEMARACLDALERAVDTAIEREAAFVVIAGDLFDSEAPDLRDSFEAAARLARLWRAGIDVYWLLGNHDFGPAADALPASPRLHRFSARRAESFEIEALGVALHGRSFPTRAATENFALGYPRARSGLFNIGVLHTSLEGRAGASTYAPCAIGDLAAMGYDYWALGHVHGAEVASTAPYVVYPGCLQGRTPRETGAKGCAVATVEDGAVVELEQVACDGARWVTIDAPVGEGTGAFEAAVLAALERGVAEADGRFAIVRLRCLASDGAAAALSQRGPTALIEEASRLALDVDDRIAVETVRIEAAPSARPARGLDAEAAALIDEAAAANEVRDALAAARDEIRARAGAAVDFGAAGLDLDAALAAARRVAQAAPGGEADG